MLRRLIAALALGSLLLSPAAAVTAQAASAFNDKQRAELNDIIKKFIAEHPEALIASVEEHYNKQTQNKQVQEGRLNEVPSDLVDANTPAFGPKDAKVTVVEFFDYNCGYCKQVAGDVTKLMADEKNVRYVFKELPILSESSMTAARYALAAHKQGKYLDYHNALMTHQGPLSENFLVETAKSIGLNTDKLKKDANLQEMRDALDKNLSLARTLGVRGTPFFLIGKEKVPGAVGYSNLKDMIATERGDKPAAAAPSAPAAAAPAATDTSGMDAETQAEINKAKEEAQAMIKDLKEQAEKMRAEAAAQQEKLQKELAAQQAKEEAEKAKADKK